MTAITQTYTFSGAGEDFGPRKGDGLVVLHTFEPTDPLKNTMRDAIAGAIWQDRNDVLGAYNRIIAVDGVLGCVPDDHISGGMAAGTAEYRPLPWLYQMLPAHMVNDGNSYSLQLCAMGRRAYYDANGWPPTIIDGFARSIIDEEQRIGRGVVVANHADFQPGNRTDAGAIALDLVMKRYAELTAPSEDDMPDLSSLEPIVNRRATVNAGATARRTPAFNPQDYDENKVAIESKTRERPALGWVTGTNLTLSDGTVYDARTRWLLTGSDTSGGIFYHERDVAGFAVAEAGITEQQLADVRADGKVIQEQGVKALEGLAVQSKSLADALRAKTIR